MAFLDARLVMQKVLHTLMQIKTKASPGEKIHYGSIWKLLKSIFQEPKWCLLGSKSKKKEQVIVFYTYSKNRLCSENVVYSYLYYTTKSESSNPQTDIFD